MSLVVQLSYEERIIDALALLPPPGRGEFIAHGQRQFDTIRAILRPLYDQARAGLDRPRLTSGESVASAVRHLCARFTPPHYDPVTRCWSGSRKERDRRRRQYVNDMRWVRALVREARDDN